MKKAEQVLTEAYAHAPADGRDYNHTWIIEAMRAFAREACREQREICASKILEWADDIKDRRSAVDVALSSPEPKMI